MNEVVVKLQTEDDIYLAISRVRSLIRDAFSDADQQAVFVTMLELGRNVINYAYCNGTIACKWVDKSLQIQVIDRGPGIPHLPEILSGNYRSQTGLGLGILGVNRLMDEFYIDSSERGTNIRAIKRPSGY